MNLSYYTGQKQLFYMLNYLCQTNCNRESDYSTLFAFFEQHEARLRNIFRMFFLKRLDSIDSLPLAVDEKKLH